MPISQEQRAFLDNIVQQMNAQNAPVEDVQAIVNDYVKKFSSAPQAQVDINPQLPQMPKPQVPGLTRDATEQEATQVGRNAEMQGMSQAGETALPFMLGGIGGKVGGALAGKVAGQLPATMQRTGQLITGLGEGYGTTAGTKAASGDTSMSPLDHLLSMLPGGMRLLALRNAKSGINQSQELAKQLTGEKNIKTAIEAEASAPRVTKPNALDVGQAEATLERTAAQAETNAAARQATANANKQARVGKIGVDARATNAQKQYAKQLKALDLQGVQATKATLDKAKGRLADALNKLDETKLDVNDELREALATSKSPEERVKNFLEYMKAKSRGGKWDKNYFEGFMDPADVDELYAARDARKAALRDYNNAKSRMQANTTAQAAKVQEKANVLGATKQQSTVEALQEAAQNEQAAAAEAANIRNAKTAVGTTKRVASAPDEVTQPNQVAAAIWQKMFDPKQNAFSRQGAEAVVNDPKAVDFLKQHYKDPDIQSKLNNLIPVLKDIHSRFGFLARVGASAVATGGMAAVEGRRDPKSLLMAGAAGVGLGLMPNLLDKALRNDTYRKTLTDASKMGNAGRILELLVQSERASDAK